MSELKIKVTWDGMAIELEGETESVKEIFNSLKESGMYIREVDLLKV